MKIYVLLAVVGFMSIANNVRAEIEPALTFSGANGLEYLSSGNSVFYNDFGVHNILGPLDDSGNTITIGADPDPYIKMQGTTVWDDNNLIEYQPTSAVAFLRYYWKITSNDGSTEPVPVHISTSGEVHSWVFTKANQDPITDNYYNITPDRMNIGVNVRFSNLPGETFGVHTGLSSIFMGGDMGITEWGVWGTNPDGSGQAISYFERGTGEFSENLDVLATPDYLNSIDMQTEMTWIPNNCTGCFYSETGYSFMAYIDPVITIDPAYADRYTLEVSYIPSVVSGNLTKMIA